MLLSNPKKIDEKKIEKAKNLTVRVNIIDPTSNDVRGFVQSETDPNKWYQVSLTADRTGCECEDFLRTGACKHQAAFFMIVQRLFVGLKPSDLK